MRKIISGMLGIVMTASVVGGVAYAAFSSTASVEGVSFSSGDANLLVSLDNSNYSVTQNASSTWEFSGLYPNYGVANDKSRDMFLKNTSTSDISLSVLGKLRSGVLEATAGDWNVLKDKVWVLVALSSDINTNTGWHSLAEWNSSGFTLPGGSIAKDAYEHYVFYVRVDGSAGNEISNAGISGVNFDFTGTQQ